MLSPFESFSDLLPRETQSHVPLEHNKKPLPTLSRNPQVNHRWYINVKSDLINRDLSQAILVGVIPSKDALEKILMNGGNLSTVTLSPEIEVTRDVLEKIVANGGNLIGLKLADGIDVSGMKFTNVKMDGDMLRSLIDLGANVQGVDLSEQNLEFINLKGVDLSNANLSRTNLRCATLVDTNFKNATFNQTCLDYSDLIRTNLEGVDLSGSSLKYVTYNTGSPVKVSEVDRAPYVDLYEHRLYFVVNQDGGKNGDPFCQLPADVIKEFRDAIFFPRTDKSFLEGETVYEGGAQSLLLKGDIDERYINTFRFDGEQITDEQIIERKKDAKEKLMENGFTLAQKSLFHSARTALWKVWNFNAEMVKAGFLNASHESEQKVLFQIYLDGGVEGRLTPDMKLHCFYAVLPYIANQHSEMTSEEISQVRELFISPDYFW